MSMGWEKSNLVYGEELKVPVSIFVEPEKAGKRLVSANYVGENDAGIMIDFVFRPATNSIAPESFHYRRMVNWASIWAGHVKISRKDGEQIFAKREKGLPVAIGQYRGGYQFDKMTAMS